MTKCIRIETCRECMFLKFGGTAKGLPYRPVCGAMEKKVLPYVVVLGRAHMTGNIPDWCPLEDLEPGSAPG